MHTYTYEHSGAVYQSLTLNLHDGLNTGLSFPRGVLLILQQPLNNLKFTGTFFPMLRSSNKTRADEEPSG